MKLTATSPLKHPETDAGRVRDNDRRYYRSVRTASHCALQFVPGFRSRFGGPRRDRRCGPCTQNASSTRRNSARRLFSRHLRNAWRIGPNAQVERVGDELAARCKEVVHPVRKSRQVGQASDDSTSERHAGLFVDSQHRLLLECILVIRTYSLDVGAARFVERIEQDQ